MKTFWAICLFLLAAASAETWSMDGQPVGLSVRANGEFRTTFFVDEGHSDFELFVKLHDGPNGGCGDSKCRHFWIKQRGLYNKYHFDETPSDSIGSCSLNGQLLGGVEKEANFSLSRLVRPGLNEIVCKTEFHFDDWFERHNGAGELRYYQTMTSKWYFPHPFFYAELKDHTAEVKWIGRRDGDRAPRDWASPAFNDRYWYWSPLPATDVSAAVKTGDWVWDKPFHWKCSVRRSTGCPATETFFRKWLFAEDANRWLVVAAVDKPSCFLNGQAVALEPNEDGYWAWRANVSALLASGPNLVACSVKPSAQAGNVFDASLAVPEPVAATIPPSEQPAALYSPFIPTGGGGDGSASPMTGFAVAGAAGVAVLGAAAAVVRFTLRASSSRPRPASLAALAQESASGFTSWFTQKRREYREWKKRQELMREKKAAIEARERLNALSGFLKDLGFTSLGKDFVDKTSASLLSDSKAASIISTIPLLADKYYMGESQQARFTYPLMNYLAASAGAYSAAKSTLPVKFSTYYGLADSWAGQFSRASEHLGMTWDDVTRSVRNIVVKQIRGAERKTIGLYTPRGWSGKNEPWGIKTFPVESIRINPASTAKTASGQVVSSAMYYKTPAHELGHGYRDYLGRSLSGFLEEGFNQIFLKRNVPSYTGTGAYNANEQAIRNHPYWNQQIDYYAPQISPLRKAYVKVVNNAGPLAVSTAAGISAYSNYKAYEKGEITAVRAVGNTAIDTFDAALIFRYALSSPKTGALFMTPPVLAEFATNLTCDTFSPGTAYYSPTDPCYQGPHYY
jgi:hypothetical protein